MNWFKQVGVVLNLKQINNLVLRHAQELVTFNQATIHLICATAHPLNHKQQQDIEAFLNQQVNFDYSLTYLIGKPIVEIARYSSEHELDLLLVEPDMMTGMKRFFFGSLAMSLIRRAPCPVWVVKQPVSDTYQRILIAVDPNDENETTIALNDKLIQIGTSYARKLSAECYLITAWCLPGESMLSGPFIHTPDVELEKLKVAQKVECAHNFEKLQARHKAQLKGCATRMIHGDPGYSIVEFVRDQRIDLVIMGTLARSGMQGLVIGNTAETVISQIECSIMAIKPDGFVSPIST